MGLIRLFTSFDGRIGRMAYWFGILVLVLVSPFSFKAIMSSNPFQAAFSKIGELGPVGLLWTLGLLIPLAALNTKRLHDMGKSGLVAVLFYAPAALSAFTLFTGYTPPGFDKIMSWTLALAGVLGATSAWFLFRLGLKGGTRGPNKYGPDPAG